MSSAETAVRLFRELESEDFRTLTAIEVGMASHEYVPVEDIVRFSNLTLDEVTYRLKRLNRHRLVFRWHGPYVGYTLNYAGYDCLAINALVKAGVLEAFGKSLGVGKEADVYDALIQDNERVAVKFHRLGRTSFRQTRRKRSYVSERKHVSWLYQSRLAAEREFYALKLLYPCGVDIPKPIAQNRHTIVMGMIEGVELADYIDFPDKKIVLQKILENVRRAYLKAGIIHADLSEYNILLKPDGHILIIDWPQFVTKDHPNADRLLKRDLSNIIKFFNRKFQVKSSLKEALSYVQS